MIGKTILILGVANLIADAISIGLGDYISSKAEDDVIVGERKREEWEIENYLQGEKQEMVDLYTKRGLSRSDAVTVVDILAKDKKVIMMILKNCKKIQILINFSHFLMLFLQIFLYIMVVEELGIMPEREGEVIFFF